VYHSTVLPPGVVFHCCEAIDTGPATVSVVATVGDVPCIVHISFSSTLGPTETLEAASRK
jgi:hypothetical protein